MSEFTPGPWYVPKGQSFVVDAPIPEKEECDRDFRIAKTYVGPFSPDQEQSRANARLIAAAPDLLEVCLAWLDVWNSNRDIDRVVKTCDLLERTEAATKKARGLTS